LIALDQLIAAIDGMNGDGTSINVCVILYDASEMVLGGEGIF